MTQRIGRVARIRSQRPVAASVASEEKGRRVTRERPDYPWLISRRSQIQETLLALHDLIATDDDRSALENDPVRRKTFGLLMGAAFSLWRAAFLSHGEHEWPPVLRHAKTFLERLLRDNAIAYTQDQETRDWTAGYYLNNAMFRLVRARGVLSIQIGRAHV